MNKIILASGSQSRKAMLENAGIKIVIQIPKIDEAKQKEIIRQKNPEVTPSQLAIELAKAKAESVSAQTEPEHIIIGADQVLSLGQEIFDKPSDKTQAINHLRKLQGKTHNLETAIVCIQNQTVIWTYLDRPSLTMRKLGDNIIEQYIQEIDTEASETVGAYKLEKQGIQLFEKIDGDYFSILGLPLIPLLSFLRNKGILN